MTETTVVKMLYLKRCGKKNENVSVRCIAMNSYFTDVVGDENFLFTKYKFNFDLERMKRALESESHVMPSGLTIEEMISHIHDVASLQMCSCGSRQKHKCVKESESGYGKMCLKGVYET